MIANYHMHTYRCHHASGTEREYIERAIEGGLTEIGFSDHAPSPFPEGRESSFRVPVAEAEEYVSTLRALREEYKDKIKIHIGFEMEYYPLYFEGMLSFVKSVGAEYLILGQHFIGNEHPTETQPYGNHSHSGGKTEENLCEYADCVIAAIKSGAFSYIAHPDMFTYDMDSPEYDREMRRVCKAAKEYGIPLEINCLGIRDSRSYPDERFWKIAGSEGCTAIIGFDSHNPQSAYDGESIPKAMKIAKTYGLTVVERLDLKKLQAL